MYFLLSIVILNSILFFGINIDSIGKFTSKTYLVNGIKLDISSIKNSDQSSSLSFYCGKESIDSLCLKNLRGTLSSFHSNKLNAIYLVKKEGLHIEWKGNIQSLKNEFNFIFQNDTSIIKVEIVGNIKEYDIFKEVSNTLILSFIFLLLSTIPFFFYKRETE